MLSSIVRAKLLFWKRWVLFSTVLSVLVIFVCVFCRSGWQNWPPDLTLKKILLICLLHPWNCTEQTILAFRHLLHKSWMKCYPSCHFCLRSAIEKRNHEYDEINNICVTRITVRSTFFKRFISWNNWWIVVAFRIYHTQVLCCSFNIDSSIAFNWFG